MVSELSVRLRGVSIGSSESKAAFEAPTFLLPSPVLERALPYSGGKTKQYAF